MHTFRQLLALFALCLGLIMTPAHAETFHTCGTIIASIPTVITTQGVYCLSHDVSTAITSGKAIDVQTNNVTIDCNGYKIGGLAAGTSSQTYGIFALSRQNITVRNCGVRGFLQAVHISNGAGNLIEDNRLDNNLWVGMYVGGDNNRVRRNAIYDTGGSPGLSESIGMSISADAVDNTVAGLFATGGDPANVGIFMNGDGTEARGNQIHGLTTSGAGTVTGIQATAIGVTVR
ncbi:MAG TPA: right-handed parallel beta-helix repeat-containing protein, partial [Luteimonas sp.]|nr:right-handed parallel beta-helix repeat-containing protein [Luteimonas sp.]